MNAQSAAATRLEHCQVACGLGVDDHTEGEFLPWNRQIVFVIGGDFKEDAGVGAAFVVLAGGVEKARAEAQAGGYLFRIAHLVAQALDRRLMLGEHGQVGKSG